MDGLAILCEVIADGIHWAIVLGGAETPDRVELLKAEPQGVNDRMTVLAGLRTREL